MPHDILVPREDWIALLRIFRGISRSIHPEEALIAVRGNELEVAVAGMAATAQCDGAWASAVRVPASFIIAAAAAKPPQADPVRLQVRDARLYVDQFSIPCVVSATEPEPIELPLNADLLTVLRLCVRYSDDKLRSAGLAPTIAKAKEDARRRFDRAAEILAPLGVAADEIEAFFWARLRSAAGDRT